jgi:hypothetical protein
MSSWAWIALVVTGAFWFYAVVWALIWAKTRRLYAVMTNYRDGALTFVQVAGRQRDLARALALAQISDLELVVEIADLS